MIDNLVKISIQYFQEWKYFFLCKNYFEMYEIHETRCNHPTTQIGLSKTIIKKPLFLFVENKRKII